MIRDMPSYHCEAVGTCIRFLRDKVSYLILGRSDEDVISAETLNGLVLDLVV